MKRKKIKISILILVSIFVLYYLLSILFARNRQFVNYDFPSQLSIENSVYNNNFIREIKPDKIVVIDTFSYEKTKDDLEIYLCEAYYYKNYGIFNLFSHKEEFLNSICLNINSKTSQKIFLEYDNSQMVRMGSSNSYWNIFKIGSDVNVKFFDRDKQAIFEMMFFNIKR